MPTRTSNVFVPVGGGISRHQEEFLVQPPSSRSASNAVTRVQGSYSKKPGGTLTPDLAEDTQYPGALFSEPLKHLLYLGTDRGRALSGTDAFSIVHPAKPLEVSGLHLLPRRGLLFDPQVAVVGGFLAVIVGHMGDQTSVGSTTASIGGVDKAIHLPGQAADEVIFAVYRTDGTLVSGPFRTTDVDMAWKVEGLTIGGAPSFVFLGCESFGSPKRPRHLKATRITATAPPTAAPSWVDITDTDPIPTSLTTTFRTSWWGDDQADMYVAYDSATHRDHTLVYVAVGRSSGLTVYPVDGVTASPGGAALFAGSSAKNYAIWYDHDTQTVLVYDNQIVYYSAPNPLSFSSVGGAVDAPHPIWYKSDIDQLFLDGSVVSLSGSNPATPTPSASRTVTVPGKSKKPQPINARPGHVLFFDHESGHVQESLAATSVVSDNVAQSWFDAVMAFRLSGAVADDEGMTAAPLMSTKIGRYYGAGTIPARRPGVTNPGNHFLQPTSSIDDNGRIYVASVVTNPASRAVPHKFQDHHVLVNVISVVDNEVPPSFSVVPYQGSLLIAAGDLTAYDGQAFHNLVSPPFIKDAPGGGRFQAPVNASNHATRAVLVFVDANGIEYRSAPSEPLYSPSISGSMDPPNDIVLELDASHQRTFHAGQGYELEWFTTKRVANDAGTDPTGGGANDVVHDYFLEFRGPVFLDSGLLKVKYNVNVTKHGDLLDILYPLYTTGLGELAPVRPPSTRVLASAGSYLFLVPDEAPFEIWPSKPVEHGRGPEWAPELVIPAPSESGGVVSLAGQGDRLILLCKTGVWELFAADGPTATGQGGFGGFRRIHLGDGCLTHMGTAVGPFGIIYISSSGPKLVQPDGTVADVGAPLRGVLDPNTVIQSVYNPAESEVWILTSGPSHFVWSHRTGAWTSISLETRAVANHQGSIYRLPVGSKAAEVEDATQARTGTSKDILMGVVSPWLSFTTPQGWKRCNRIGILGRLDAVGTTGQLVVGLAYDYIDSDEETYTWTAAEIDALGRKFQLWIKPKRQKWDSCRITITEGTTSDPQGGKTSTMIWTLVGYEFEMRTKTGIIKLESGAHTPVGD